MPEGGWSGRIPAFALDPPLEGWYIIEMCGGGDV